MVLFRDVVKRHAGYVGMHVVVAHCGDRALLCTAALALIVLCLKLSTKTTAYFYAIAGAWMTLVELVTAVLARSGRPNAPLLTVMGVPPWAPLGWAIVAQWSMDIFCVATALGTRSADDKEGKLPAV
jgi:hypothetical protein